jgi:hypothetical protein
MEKKFQRKIEDFECENCGEQVVGNGYTNHCPRCLFSKHVDINPGDRTNECGGLMEPVDAFLKNGEWVLVQRCQKCGEEKRIKTREDDNRKKIEEILNKKIIEMK